MLSHSHTFPEPIAMAGSGHHTEWLIYLILWIYLKPKLLSVTTGSLSLLFVLADADSHFFWKKTCRTTCQNLICLILKMEWYSNHPKNLHVFPGALLAPVGGQLHAPCCGKPPKRISFNPECCEPPSRTVSLLTPVCPSQDHGLLLVEWSPELGEIFFHGTLL